MRVAGAAPDPTPALERAIEVVLPDCQKVHRPLMELSPSVANLAESLAKLGCYPEAMAAAPDERCRQEVLYIAARRLAYDGDMELALGFAARIQATGDRCDILLAVVRRYLRQGRPDLADDLLRKVSPLARATDSPAVLAYCAWLFARCNDIPARDRLFAAAHATHGHADDMGQVPPSGALTLYEAAAGLYYQAQQDAGIDEDALLHLISQACRNNDFDAAKRSARCCDALCQRYADIALYQGENNAKAALQTLREERKLLDVVEPHNKADLCVIAAGIAMECDDMKAGREWYEQALDWGVEPGFGTIYYLEQFEDPAIYRNLDVSTQLTAIDRTIQYLVHVQNREETFPEWIEVAAAQKRLGQADVARTTYRQIANAARDAFVKSPGEESLHFLLWSASLMRDDGDAAESDGMMRQAMLTPLEKNTANDLIGTLAAFGYYDQALAMLNAAPGPHGYGYMTLAIQQTEAQGPLATLKWVANLPDPEDRADALAAIVREMNSPTPEENELALRRGTSDNPTDVSVILHFPDIESTIGVED